MECGITRVFVNVERYIRRLRFRLSHALGSGNRRYRFSLKSEVIHSGVNSSEVDLDDGTYCIEAQVNGSEKEVSCFDIGKGLTDNDDLDVDVDGIDLTIMENTSVNFTIETTLEGNITWEIIELQEGTWLKNTKLKRFQSSL